jgi:Fe-S cluster assembly protein SufD
LPGPADTWPRREAALAELAAVGWPTPQRERWRYTDLKTLAAGDFELAPSLPQRPDIELAASILTAVPVADKEHRLVFVDGHRIPELGATAIENLEIADLETGWHGFDARYADRIATGDHPLAALNTAFTQQGLWLRVPARVAIAAPLHLLFVSSPRAALAPQPRIVIETGEDASFTVVQHYIDGHAGSGWINSVTQVQQAARSKLDLYRIQRHGPDQAHTSLLAAELGADAELTVGYIDLGGRLIRNDVDVKLAERGARTELFGLFLAGAGQHIDDHILVDHAAPETRSDESFRGIIGRRGRGVFNGKVIVRPNAQRIDARQSSDNLLLAEQAEIDTKPEFEIYADDVKCSHGSTVGELDADQLFYLRTRGIDDAEARELLTTAFAATVVERVRDPELHEYLVGQVTARLSKIAEQPT